MVNIFLCDDNPLQLRCVHDFIESYMANKSAQIFDYSSPQIFCPVWVSTAQTSPSWTSA